MKRDETTNAMRMLERAGAVFTPFAYEAATALSGMEIAAKLGMDPSTVFKTLVTVGASKKHYVFVVPAEKELDLKKAASAAGEKSVSMIKQAELLPLTGYVHGGCSPVGMKKQFTTVIDVSARELDAVIVSAGKIGRQIMIAPGELAKACPFSYAAICRDPA